MNLSQFRFSIGAIRQKVTQAISPRQNHRILKSWQRYWRDFDAYRTAAPHHEKYRIHACLDDWTADTPVEPIYFYQDNWAFARIIKNAPKSHVDIGSHHKFVALLSNVVPTTMVDTRPLPVSLKTLNFVKGSILDLPFESGSLESVSSMCVVEHIGLGRYNDPIDPQGTIKALNELKRVLKPGGTLLISVPIHDENITYFNAHRAFTETTIRAICTPLEVSTKAYIYGMEMKDEPQPGGGTICLELTKH